MFKKGTQNFTTSDPTYSVPVVRARNPNSPATVKWRTKKSQRLDLSGVLKFNPGETEKDIVIDPNSKPGPVTAETIQLELFDPSSNASVGERKTTLINVIDGADQLYPYCDYETRVCAYNAMGDGYDTDMVPCQTLEDGNYSEFTILVFIEGDTRRKYYLNDDIL
ncbi:hypothetical protein F7725_013752 [Dissostichus mawsoni]|uniref:Uncharacterized protein n=1 Tax=Dissostichus mawsoni TaxID=36200 RepID=A0A7J5YTX8_DISMA|nr:hypothetical protein F7725_013752 [Dissostichus mawsoni]